MSRAFVLGNGVSRQDVDLNNLKHFGPIYGCNALYRDFTPTVLISTDSPISRRIQDSGYALKHKFYTRRPESGSGARPVPQKYFGYSSGPLAASIAALDGCVIMYLVGFDMGPVNNHFNNVYATKNLCDPFWRMMRPAPAVVSVPSASDILTTAAISGLVAVAVLVAGEPPTTPR